MRRLFTRLSEEFGLTLAEISKRIGKSESYVSNTMRLLALPDAIKDGLISGAISEGHARAIAGLGDIKIMIEAYKTILSENASVRRAEDLARRLKLKMGRNRARKLNAFTVKNSIRWQKYCTIHKRTCENNAV